MQTTTDARSLSSNAQETLRLKAVAAVEEGMKQKKAAEVFGVHKVTINRWVRMKQEKGRRALRAKKQGRPRAASKLKPWEAAKTVRSIADRCPDQMQLPFFLWTREAVQQFIKREFGVDVSVWTIGRMLKQWGLTPQKPVKRAYEKNPKAVTQWLEEEYPAIQKKALAEGAEIQWGDEMGVRSDHQTGTTYGRKGKTPCIPCTGRRFKCNMISSISNRGVLRFMLYKGRFNAPLFLQFLKRLIKQSDKKVFLILDRHPVHRDRKVGRWVEANADDIAIFFLPGYSPELNPDEFLNNDVKANAVGRKRPKTLPELIKNLRSALKKRQCNPEMVKAYFRAPSVRYAA